MQRFENCSDDHHTLQDTAYNQQTSRYGTVVKLVKWLTIIVLLLIVAVSNIQLVSVLNKISAETQSQSNTLKGQQVKYSSIPTGQAVWGLTVLDNELYVLRNRADELEVYDTQTLVLKRRLAVPALHIGNDITSSAECQCVYIADLVKDSIHRVTKDGGVTTWTVPDGAQGLAVNSAGNLLVTFREPSKVIEYTTLGRQVAEIDLPTEIVNATHVVELGPNKLAVAHGSADSPFHRVCLVNSNGNLLKCYPGNVGTSLGQLHYPVRLAVAKGQLLVDDLSNDQILLLNSELIYVHDVISRYDGLQSPVRLFYDDAKSQLYVADNELKADVVVSGNVKIFNVNIQ